MVEYGKIWKIDSEEDFRKALETLEWLDFRADMSDSYAVTFTEKAEISRQRKAVMAQAQAKGWA